MLNADFIIYGNAPTERQIAAIHDIWQRVQHPVKVCYCFGPGAYPEFASLPFIESTATVLPLEEEPTR